MCLDACICMHLSVQMIRDRLETYKESYSSVPNCSHDKSQTKNLQMVKKEKESVQKRTYRVLEIVALSQVTSRRLVAFLAFLFIISNESSRRSDSLCSNAYLNIKRNKAYLVFKSYPSIITISLGP